MSPSFKCNLRASGPLDKSSESSSPADIAVANLLEQTARAIYDRRGPDEIHPGQWAALRFFARANRGVRNVGGLARYLGITGAPASRAVAALRRHGLVDVQKNDKDRRVATITLTREGRDLLAHDPIQRLSRAISELAPSEREILGRLLADLSERLAAYDGGTDITGRGRRDGNDVQGGP